MIPVECFFLPPDDLIPHYYYVPKTYIDAEKKEPHSQVRLPSDEPDVFLWGQSLLVIVELLGEIRLSQDCASLFFSRGPDTIP